jgi:hypothetical protein
MRTLTLRATVVALLAAATLVGLVLGNQVLAAAAVQIDGRVSADADKDGKASNGDRGVKTLVELQKVDAGKVTSVTSLFTDANGSFAFTAVPDGEYQLVVWWSPGFVSPAADPARPQSIVVSLNAQTASQAQLRGLAFLVNPKPDDSLIPWPVRTGQDALPQGTAAVGAATLPATGQGPFGRTRPPTLYFGLLALGAVLLTASSLFLWSSRKAR